MKSKKVQTPFFFLSNVNPSIGKLRGSLKSICLKNMIKIDPFDFEVDQVDNYEILVLGINRKKRNLIPLLFTEFN